MPLSKDVRDAVVARLADPNFGMNARIAQSCADWGLDLPGLKNTPDSPFQFSAARSPNVFYLDMSIDQMEKDVPYMQYPILQIFTSSARQNTENKITPGIFWGIVMIEIRVWFSWLASQPPDGNDYESPLDAFQFALYGCLNGGINQPGQPGCTPRGSSITATSAKTAAPRCRSIKKIPAIGAARCTKLPSARLTPNRLFSGQFMNANYRFVGDAAYLHMPTGPLELRTFGQAFSLDSDLADSLLKKDNIQILSDKDFDGVGFTEEELKAYPTAFAQIAAPEEFKDKKKKALELLHDRREAMRADTPAPPADDTALIEAPVLELPPLLPAAE